MEESYVDNRQVSRSKKSGYTTVFDELPGVLSCREKGHTEKMTNTENASKSTKTARA
jgi:hypothetical protein